MEVFGRSEPEEGSQVCVCLGDGVGSGVDAGLVGDGDGLGVGGLRVG